MPRPPSHPGYEPAPLNREAVHAILRAARFGADAYPGPVGELIGRALGAYLEGGWQLPPDSMPERLLAVLRPASGHDAGTTTGRDRLPAVYRNGTPLHWAYPAAGSADAAD